MSNVFVIAWMTFVEARRNRILWSLLFFCLALVLTSFLFQEVTVATLDRVIRDVGLATLNGFGMLLAIFLGVSVVTREIERRTVYVLLSKPLGRGRYLLGKLLGVWFTLVIALSAMFLAFLVENAAYAGNTPAILFQAFWLMLVELLVVTSFSILASTFTSSAMSAFMTASLVVAGHLTTDIYFFSSKSKSILIKRSGAALFYLLPNLEKLNLKTDASLLRSVPAAQVCSATAYGLVYVAAFFVLSLAFFRRRDLK